jgi:hypothetical protein
METARTSPDPIKRAIAAAYLSADYKRANSHTRLLMKKLGYVPAKAGFGGINSPNPGRPAIIPDEPAMPIPEPADEANASGETVDEQSAARRTRH